MISIESTGGGKKKRRKYFSLEKVKSLFDFLSMKFRILVTNLTLTLFAITRSNLQSIDSEMILFLQSVYCETTVKIKKLTFIFKNYEIDVSSLSRFTL